MFGKRPKWGAKKRPADLQDAARHLIDLLRRVAKEADVEPGFQAELRRLRLQVDSVRGDADKEAIAEAAEGLRWPKAPKSNAGEPNPQSKSDPNPEPGNKSEDLKDLKRCAKATHDIAQAIEAEEKAKPPRPKAKRIADELERLVHGVTVLRQGTEVLRRSMAELFSVIGGLARDEPSALSRLEVVKERIVSAREIAQMEALREELLEAATELVTEAKARGHRATDARQLLAAHQDQVATLELALADARNAATIDPLTGLGNRRAMKNYIHGEAASAAAVAIVALDLDHFKAINDTHGHAAGDRVLRCVAESIRGELRGADRAYRTGGEEMLALLPGTNLDGARRTADRLREVIAATAIPNGAGQLRVTVSAGVALWSAGQSFKQASESADKALYQAKRGGRNRVEVHPR